MNQRTLRRDSPLLPLLLPLAVGIGFGLENPLDDVLGRLLWAFMVLGIAGLFLLQRQLSRHPFDSRWHVLFRAVVAGEVALFGLNLGSSQQDSLPQSVRERDWKVVVVEPPVRKAKTYSITGFVEEIHGQAVFYLSQDSCSKDLQSGQFLLVHASLKKPEPLGDFDYPAYLKGKGILYTAFVPSGKWRGTDAFPLPWTLEIRLKALQYRNLLLRRLDRVVKDPSTRALAHAMVLGDKTDLTAGHKETYSVAGLSHLLALSGMHLGFIVALLLGLTCRLKPALQRGIVLTGIWAFIVLVGLPVSALRAGCMLTLLLVNPFRQERTSALDRLYLAAFFLLIVHPAFLKDVGFQLSFGAVAGILLFTPVLTQRYFLPGKLQDILVVCLSAQLGVLPLTLHYFGTFPLYFLLTNLVVTTFFAPLFVYLSLLTLLVADWSQGSALCARSLTYLVDRQQVFLQLIRNLPGPQWQVDHFPWVAVVLSYGLLGLALQALEEKME